MKLNDLIVKLTIMKKNEPSKFKSYMNKLKIEQPDVYDKVKISIGVDEEGPITFGENPLNLQVVEQKKNTNYWIIFWIFLIGIIIFLIVTFILSQ